MKGEWTRKPKASAAVIFVHGFLSSGDACWRSETGVTWPALLMAEPALQDVGIYVYTYSTTFFSGTYRLGDVVDDLKERLTLDGMQSLKHLIFVCHSMGGIVVRKLIVERSPELIDRGIICGLFLVASPSLGSSYAEWFSPLARLLGHSQAKALRFSQDNDWLCDLDKEFQNLKESGRLKIVGKELVEDKFVTLKRLMRRQVVEPFSGARYFGERLKVSGSDHFSIAKPADNQAIQHRTLCHFIHSLTGDFTKTISVANEYKNSENMLKYYYYISRPKVDMLLAQVGASHASGPARQELQGSCESKLTDASLVHSLRSLTTELWNANLVSSLSQSKALTTSFYSDSGEWHSGLFALNSMAGPPSMIYALWRVFNDAIILLVGSPNNILGDKVVSSQYFVPGTSGAHMDILRYVSTDLNVGETVAVTNEPLTITYSYRGALPDVANSPITNPFSVDNSQPYNHWRRRFESGNVQDDFLATFGFREPQQRGLSLAFFCLAQLAALPLSAIEVFFSCLLGAFGRNAGQIGVVL